MSVESSLEDLFERHAVSVFRYFRRATGRPEVAEDLTQEVFVRAVRAFRRQPSRPREAAWVFRIARTVLVDYWREPRLDQLSLSDAETERLPASAPGQVVALGFWEALGVLPKGDREIFLLHAESGLTYSEVAQMVGTTEEAVRSRLYRVRRHLRRLLSRQASAQIKHR
jgi:RNA polymerase sigma-70 factor (ECF subfamily)